MKKTIPSNLVLAGIEQGMRHKGRDRVRDRVRDGERNRMLS